MSGVTGKISGDATVPYKNGIFIPGIDMSLPVGSQNVKLQASTFWQFVTPQQFGAKADGVTDDTTAVQNAVATGQPVYIPPGTYFIKQAINCNNAGQMIFGAGRFVSIIQVDSTFNMGATGVFTLTSGEPGAYLRDFRIRFKQPDTATRSALITYPAGVSVVNGPRFVLEGMSIVNATIAVNAGGNSGGAYIRDLQASFYTYGVYLDGSLDTVRITDMHCAGFEMTANQLSIAQSLGTTCIASGRCDDLKLEGCLFLFYADLSLFVGASGYTFGSAVNCSFDGFNGIQQASGGRFTITGSYFTMSQAGFVAANISNGILYIENSWFGQANSGTAMIDVVSGVSTDVARLILTGCTFETSTGDVSAVVVNAAGGGFAEAIIQGCGFNRTPNTAYAQPTISVGGNINSLVTIMGCRSENKGTGGGVFINIPFDAQHRVIGNCAPGWTNHFPTAAAGVYQFN